jgi:DNA invertase Pin-like site-specific DNA recombinase
MVKTKTFTPPPVDDPPPERPQHMVGYARVSMSDQNNQRQIDELTKFGVDPRDIFTDSASGKTMNRPGWKALAKDIREGDLLVVHALDRLGRSIVDVIRTIEELEKRGVMVKVLTMDIDTRTPIGRFVIHIMAAMAQMERELIVERTRHGLAKARERGRTGGRPQRITDEQVKDAIRREKKGEFVSDIAKEYGVSRNGLYKRIHAMKGMTNASRP